MGISMRIPKPFARSSFWQANCVSLSFLTTTYRNKSNDMRKIQKGCRKRPEDTKKAHAKLTFLRVHVFARLAGEGSSGEGGKGDRETLLPESRPYLDFAVRWCILESAFFILVLPMFDQGRDPASSSLSVVIAAGPKSDQGRNPGAVRFKM